MAVPLRPKLKIHVYTICKNEEQFVERWVAASKDADGLHVLDTGSTDKTVEKLKALGVNVKVKEYKPWRFDTPRNDNLAMIPKDADICLQVDMDEVLVPGWRRDVERCWKHNTTHMSYYYAWSLLPNGKPNQCFLYDKCHARHNYEWRKPVHEIICPKKGFTEVHAQCPATLVHHMPTGDKPTRSQYLPLLKLACEEEPEDHRNWLYYGREQYFYGHNAEAIETLKRYLVTPSATWGFERSYACVTIATCYGRLKNDLQKEMWLLKACGEEPGQREPWTELAEHYRLTGEHHHTNEGKCARCLSAYVAATRALTIPSSWRFFCSDPDAYREKVHDAASICGYYAGFRQEAVTHAWHALCINPHDDHLISNYEVNRDMAPKEEIEVNYVIDVIMLSWSKTEKEYQMCKRAIKNLRLSSPSVQYNIVVVETNKKLREEPFAETQLFGEHVTTVIPDEPFGYNQFLTLGYDALEQEKDCRHLMILNNDVVLFSDHFGEKMIEACEIYSSVCPDGLREALWGRTDPNKLYTVGYDLNVVNGWCIMFDKAILNSIPFVELFPPEIEFHNQDCYYADMLKHRGFRHALTTGAKALHLQAQSIGLMDATEKRRLTVGQQIVYDRLVAKNILKVPFEEPKVYDCFTFFNELDTLEIRLATLDSVVDRFVLVEARQTHSGKDKPLYFEQNKERYTRWLHKIEHVVVDEFPETEDRWIRENFQRNAIMDGLYRVKDKDLVLISDCDEIPHPDRVKAFELGAYKQKMYNYYYNVLNTCEDWTGTVATTGAVLRHVKPQDLRNGRHTSTYVQDGGWHFSWIGDVEAAREKLAAFAHAEFDTPEVRGKLEERMKDLVDFAGRDIKKFELVPIDDSFPDVLRHDIIKYDAHLLRTGKKVE